MKISMFFVGLMILIIMTILMAIILGCRGTWYFAWLLGTAVVVLAAAAGGILLDAEGTPPGERTRDNA